MQFLEKVEFMMCVCVWCVCAHESVCMCVCCDLCGAQVCVVVCVCLYLHTQKCPLFIIIIFHYYFILPGRITNVGCTAMTGHTNAPRRTARVALSQRAI
jgi:hypothetical protein